MLHPILLWAGLILHSHALKAVAQKPAPGDLAPKLAGTSFWQWTLVGQRETLGQACDSGRIFTFRWSAKAFERKVQIRSCVDGEWRATTAVWATQKVGVETLLLLNGKPAYYIRFMLQNGTEILRLTERGSTPTSPTRHYYLRQTAG
ncbi:hypothetical protein [Hymenobacter daecheongensis]|uniref:hypothetical protein n=1 Tax=Hymenobacter daecheongensis TaxID=496053 RepID=UPI001160E29B|nr:hypothetical protein [Hymenobacter daecheongensis]